MSDAPHSFSDLALQPSILEALENMGFTRMTEIQQKAIPMLLSSSDFLGQAPTGTGKTAAFGIPLINRLEPKQGHVQALILCPTRELAQQIAEELNAIGAVKGVNTMAVFGGERIYGQKEKLRQRDVDIVVGTPGRVLDHLGQVSLDLTQCRMAILDEADEMLDMGFRDDIEAILKQTPGGRETWLFSATISPEIRKIADQYMYFPQEIRIQPQAHSAEMIDQYYIIVPEEEKTQALRKFLKETPDAYGIIFCQTKRDTFLLGRKLREYFAADYLHGAMPQHERDKVMEALKKRELKLIVATDVVARGIDIDSLTHIINYEPPADPESYIHRIGRTARKGETGVAITFFTPEQIDEYQQLEKRVGMALKKYPGCELEFLPRLSNAQRKKRRAFHGGGPRPQNSGGGSSSGQSRRRRRRPPSGSNPQKSSP